MLGVVYDITDAQLAKLQGFEGTSPIDIVVELENGSEIKNAKTFLWKTAANEHKPPEAYRRRIEEAMIEHGYDANIVSKALVDKFGT